MVELDGLAVGLGPRKTAQPLVWSVTVRLPVTAVALEGTPPWPDAAKVAGLLADSALEMPLPVRVSSRRAGVKGT